MTDNIALPDMPEDRKPILAPGWTWRLGFVLATLVSISIIILFLGHIGTYPENISDPHTHTLSFMCVAYLGLFGAAVCGLGGVVVALVVAALIDIAHWIIAGDGGQND